MRRSPVLLAGLALLTACSLGPNYRRPEVAIPPTYRGAETGAAAPSVGDLGWWQLFQDPELQDLIRTALAENYDIRVAVARILQAQAQVAVTRSQEFPTLNAEVTGQYDRLTGGKKPPPTTPRESLAPQGGLSIAWELDLWGRLRRATESARAQMLASEEARSAVMTTLVAEVAQDYFSLRELDLELEITRRTLASRELSLNLVRARLEGGVSQLMDVRQAEVLVSQAAQTIPDVERRIEQTENSIALLLGRAPGPIKRGRPLDQQLTLPAVPAGLPSELLARRADVRQAEQQLVAANAQIGAAKALFFPQVTISGFGGAGGVVLNGQSFGPFGVFSALPVITLPIFNMGRVQAGVDLAEAQTQEAVVRYRQTIQQALGEVSDALVEHRKRQEFRLEQERLTRTLQDASVLSRMRYEGGVTNYLEVLDTERSLFGAEVDLARAQLNELAAVIQLYKALGGGWELQDPPPKKE